MKNQMENQLENLNQRVEVIEESLTLTIKKLAVEHKRIVDKLVEYQQKVDEEHDYTKDVLKALTENREELKVMSEINADHYNARDHVDKSVEKVKQYIEQAAAYFSKAFQQLDNKIKELPSKYVVKHHHHLVPKSTGLIIVWMVLVLAILASLSWGITNQLRIEETYEDQVKLRALKLSVPKLYAQVDSLYNEDSSRFEKKIQQEESSAE